MTIKAKHFITTLGMEGEKITFSKGDVISTFPKDEEERLVALGAAEFVEDLPDEQPPVEPPQKEDPPHENDAEEETPEEEIHPEEGKEEDAEPEATNQPEINFKAEEVIVPQPAASKKKGK